MHSLPIIRHKTSLAYLNVLQDTVNTLGAKNQRNNLNNMEIVFHYRGVIE